jgi:hypothetical protein
VTPCPDSVSSVGSFTFFNLGSVSAIKATFSGFKGGFNGMKKGAHRIGRLRDKGHAATRIFASFDLKLYDATKYHHSH